MCTGLIIIICVLIMIILFSLPGMEHNSAEYLHTVIEALSLSFADTLWYNADPSKIQVPVSGLLSKDYAAKRRSLIRQDRLVNILCSRTSCKRPTKIRRFRGCIRELVAYESRPTGGLFQEEVLTNPLFGRVFIACNFQVNHNNNGNFIYLFIYWKRGSIYPQIAIANRGG